jgi:hypothetical protein
MKTILAVLVAWALCGCAGGETFRLFNFTPEESASHLSAADEWCSSTDGDWCPLPDSSADNLVVIQDNTRECPPTEPGRTRTGCARRIGASYGVRSHLRIVILDRRNEPDWLPILRQLILHELGHAGGCSPAPTLHLAPGNVMAEHREDEPEHLTAADIACVD